MITTNAKAKIIMRVVREANAKRRMLKQPAIGVDEPQDINNLSDEAKLYQTIISHKSHPSALNGEGKKLEQDDFSN
jgi:hypothetical protein